MCCADGFDYDIERADPDASAAPTRRGFLGWLLGSSAGALILAVLYPVIRYIIPPEVSEAASASVTLPIAPQDVEPNSGQIFKFGSRPGILVRTPGGELRAFSAVCTHLACIVQYRPDFSHIWCACHNGHFDLNGVNIQGPPPKPLESYVVNVLNDQIVVSRSA
jgi:Rieske Fe-S protein